MNKITGYHTSVFVSENDEGTFIRDIDKVGSVKYFHAIDSYNRNVILVDSFCPPGETDYRPLGPPIHFLMRSRIKTAIAVNEGRNGIRFIFKPDL